MFALVMEEQCFKNCQMDVPGCVGPCITILTQLINIILTVFWKIDRYIIMLIGRSMFQNALALSIEMLRKIWKPDTFVYNGKKSYLHTITTPNRFVRCPIGKYFTHLLVSCDGHKRSCLGCFPTEEFCIPSASQFELTVSWIYRIFQWTDRGVLSRLAHVSKISPQCRYFKCKCCFPDQLGPKLSTCHVLTWIRESWIYFAISPLHSRVHSSRSGVSVDSGTRCQYCQRHEVVTIWPHLHTDW